MYDGNVIIFLNTLPLILRVHILYPHNFIIKRGIKCTV